MRTRVNIESTIVAFIRISIGIIFIVPGLVKVSNPKQIVEGFKQWGIPLPYISAPVVSWVELLGGLFLAFGLLTQIAAGLLACNCVGILIFYDIPHLPRLGSSNISDIFNYISGVFLSSGWLLLGITLLFMLYGAGRYSLDTIFGTGKQYLS